MTERIDRSPPSAPYGVAWTGLLGAPLVPWACHGGPLIAIHLVNLTALLLVAVAAALTWRERRRAGREVSGELPPPAGRAGFLAEVGLMSCGLSGLAILAQMTGAFFFGPRQR